MTVVIAGGHGKIGLQLGRLLAFGGTEVRGIIRNPDHAVELEAAGVMPALCDLEGEAGELTGIVSGADAACGPRRRPTRPWPPAALTTRSSGRGPSPTIPATGHVQIAERLERGLIPRADVAAVLAAMLDAPNTVGAAVDLLAGPLAIAAAIAAIAPASATR